MYIYMYINICIYIYIYIWEGAWVTGSGRSCRAMHMRTLSHLENMPYFNYEHIRSGQRGIAEKNMGAELQKIE